MKKMILVAAAVTSISLTTMSCNKEYNCECENYSVIVEAPSQGDAESTCDTKGDNCDIR